MLDLRETASAIVIPCDMPLADLQARIAEQPRLNFIHVDLKPAAPPEGQSLITLARRNEQAKALLVCLANSGFHLYTVRESVSSFVRHRRIGKLWRDVVSGKIRMDAAGIPFTLEPPKAKGRPMLLVVFSSIAGVMYTPSLYRHFEQNFSTIGKYVPPNAAILRIADMGGVVGSFYLNSLSLPQHEEQLRDLIQRTADGLGVGRGDIVLYGGSKGGTAAVYHGLRWGWRAVAADPILSDEHYVRTYRDSHFTLGTFAAPKEERFAELFGMIHPEADLAVVCSQRSPQFKYIKPMIDRFSDRFLFLDSRNEAIKDHPDVGRNTIPHALAQINLRLAGLPPQTGYYEVV